MNSQLILSLICALASVCFIANWLLAQIDVVDNKVDAWKCLLIGLLFVGIGYLNAREA